MALTMREARWRPALVEQALAGLGDGESVVDVGTGTGAIALALARSGSRVTAVDGDPAILRRARVKPGADVVDWVQADATALPLGDGTAARATCALLLHHLATDAKQAALGELHRVLRPGGRLHVADWGAPAAPLAAAGFTLLQAFDGRAGTRDHRAGRLPAMIRAAGFSDVRATRRLPTVWGTLELLRAVR